MVVFPMGIIEGGTRAGITVTVGINPLLSAATGTCQDMVAMGSPESVFTTMSAGQSMFGGLTSENRKINIYIVKKHQKNGIIICKKCHSSVFEIFVSSSERMLLNQIVHTSILSVPF